MNTFGQDWKFIYQRFDSATVYEAAGRVGALDSRIKPITPGMRLCGPAFTVRCAPRDNLAIHRALAEVKAGEILVVDAAGDAEAGYWGEVMTAAAQGRKVGGLVIDGGVRDARASSERGFAIFARGICIRSTEKRNPGVIQIPVFCGGEIVRPGDLILGDDDGVVAVARDRLEEVASKARLREDSENRYIAELETGKVVTLDVLGLRKYLRERPHDDMSQ